MATKRKKKVSSKKRTHRSSRKKRQEDIAKSQNWRRSSAWHNARKKCLELHGNKCWLSGEVCDPHELDVHHIKDASTHPEIRFDQSNLIPAKRKLHQYYHKSLGGFQKTTNKMTLVAFKALVRSMKFTKKVTDKAKIKLLGAILIGLVYLLSSEMSNDNLMIVQNIANFIKFLEEV